MSLINQMLRDLEERRQKEASNTASITAVSVTRKRRWPWFVAGVALIAGGGVALIGSLSPSPDSVESQPVVVSHTDTTAPVAVVPHEVVEPPTNAVLSLLASETDRELRIVMELRQPVDWHVVQSDPRSVAVAVPLAVHATLNTGSLHWLDHWRQIKTGSTNELIFSASGDMTWNVFSLAGDSQHGWRLVIQGRVEENVTSSAHMQESAPTPQPVAQPVAPKPQPAPAAQHATGTLKKQVTPREQLWSAAQQARQQGNLPEATRVLGELVNVAPDDRNGRFELIKVLLQQRNAEQALQVAESGRQRQPEEPLWLILKARLLAETDQLAEALYALDVDPAPAVSQSPEFYALKAALLQKATRYQDALPIYQHLCGAFPQQPQWWFGRAVTADQVGDQQQARDSFRQALALPGLETQLQLYATQQLQRLGDGN
ncbi:tetratricopeptide repeat protein [uncultured Desulfuromonas sp.]|uniref:tetratricopeptide repeat protein n=1 Tax=uncultured Desulfuromonas sp. TaxID=181013 RepID=UPI002AAAA3A4|nr:tetratricopeptide repeat protein [uncultured Desulfuromonas sp.]